MKVFIAGCGRSGTTYVKTLLDACDDIYIPPESLCLYDYLLYSEKLSRKRLISMFFDEPQLKSWFKGSADLKLSIPQAIEYIHSSEMKNIQAKFWGQKTPRFVRYIDLFNHYYDDIRWILVYRDPRSVVASMLKSRRHTYSISQAVARWKRDNAPIIKLMKGTTVDRNKYTFLKYENLISNFEAELNRIYQYLGIVKPASDHIFNYEYGSKKSRDYKGFRFERNEIREGLKPIQNHISSWRNTFNSNEVSYIEKECRDEMTFYGYSFEYEQSKASLSPISDLINKGKLVLILFEYIQKWPEYLWKSQRRKVLFKWWLLTSSKDQ